MPRKGSKSIFSVGPAKKPIPDSESAASSSISILLMFGPPFMPNAMPWALADITANRAMTVIEIIDFFIMMSYNTVLG